MEKDIEKSESPSAPSYDNGAKADYGSAVETHQGTMFHRVMDSFKRNPHARMVVEATDAEGRPLKDQPPAEPALAMKLKDRHLQMIAIGGSIGNYHSHQLRPLSKEQC